MTCRLIDYALNSLESLMPVGIRFQRISPIRIQGTRKDEFRDDVESLLNGQLPEGWQWVRSSPKSRVARQLKHPFSYYKQYLDRSPWELFKNLLRGSQCERARLQGEILKQKGFNSPVCYCWGRAARHHFMITEGIDAIGIIDFIQKHWQPPLGKEKLSAKRRIIKHFGATIGRLHKQGIYHGDLRLSNILLQQGERAVSFYFIDNEKNRQYKIIPKRLIHKNLVQVNLVFPKYVTRQDRLRFYKSYNNVYGRFSGKEQNRLMQRVQIRTEQRLKKIALRTHGL
jgi:tRNA A-37 threonylcarbamoyl transferase component Bud32